MSEASSTNADGSGLQILNNIGYLLGVPFLLILAVLLLVFWQYRLRQQRIAAITGKGGNQTQAASSRSGYFHRYQWAIFLVAVIGILWWQWDLVVQFWESDDWLDQLWSVVLAIHALEPADVVPLALIAFLALAVIGVFFIIKSGDTDAMKDALPWVALIIICVMILFFALR